MSNPMNPDRQKVSLVSGSMIYLENYIYRVIDFSSYNYNNNARKYSYGDDVINAFQDERSASNSESQGGQVGDCATINL